MITLPVRFLFYNVVCFLFVERILLFLYLEPLRRGDLLNAINKLAGERGAQKIHHHLMRRPIAQNYS